MIEIEPLAFKHQKMLLDLFLRMHLFFSDYSFTNLYLFRNIHKYEVVKLEGYIFIKGVTRDCTEFIMMTEFFSPPYLKALKLVLDYTKIDLIYPISDESMSLIKEQIIEASFKDEDSDYLIKVEKLKGFPGHHLSKKRNLVKQFLRDHEVRVEKFDFSHVEEAKKILELWQCESGQINSKTDYRECLEAINLQNSLNLNGQIIFANNKPVAFAIGDWLNEECYDIHFAKALKEAKGSAQFLLQEHAFSLSKENVWINLEQDLGLPLLRKSKSSYMPDRLLRKWRVRLKLKRL